LFTHKNKQKHLLTVKFDDSDHYDDYDDYCDYSSD